MKATKELHDLGQSLWLDNITRDLLDTGTLKRYIDELSVTGLTSNPTIFEHAISKSKSYDAEIGRLLSTGLTGEKFSLNWPCRISLEPPTSSPPSTSARQEMTVLFLSSCRLFSPMTPRDRWRQRLYYTRKQIVQTSSSRFPGRRKEIRRLRSRLQPVSPSTSRFFFLARTIWRRQRRTCVGSSGVLPRDSAPTFDPWPQSS